MLNKKAMKLFKDHAHSKTECTCFSGNNGTYICKPCVDIQGGITLIEQEADPTVYKFTLTIKCDIPMANIKHGAFSYYGPSVMTRTCTQKTINTEIDDLILFQFNEDVCK